MALSNTERLLRLIGEVLDFDRLDSGHEQLAYADLVAGSLAAQAVATMQTFADERNVRLELNVRDAGSFCGDGDRLLQVLTNLLSNAIKYSPEGGTVTLSVNGNDDAVCYEVRDHGRGIPPDMLEAIFEPFRQVERADRTEKHGTGLGLAICRTIVAQHQGRIWPESTPGAGSTFHVRIPRRPAVSTISPRG